MYLERLTYDTIGVCSFVMVCDHFTLFSCTLFLSGSLVYYIKDSRITQYFEFRYFIWNFWLSLERHSRQSAFYTFTRSTQELVSRQSRCPNRSLTRHSSRLLLPSNSEETTIQQLQSLLVIENDTCARTILENSDIIFVSVLEHYIYISFFEFCFYEDFISFDFLFVLNFFSCLSSS